MSKTNQDHLDDIVERVLTAPADAFTALPDDDQVLRDLCRELDAPTPAALCESLELAAASAMAASAGSTDDPLPGHLRGRILAAASAHVAPSRTTNNVTPLPSPAQRRDADNARRTPWLAGAGWAAAAALLVALIVDRPTDTATTGPIATPVAATEIPDAAEITLAVERERLLGRAGTVTLPWQVPSADGYERVRGDVVWNDELQQGFLRLAGMPVNNALVSQYQLWIVDPGRDSNPVDGGVFDIVAASGDVLIPIDAKLPVANPAAFAITREQPGGVVVSAGPLLVVAAAS